jgi:ParB family transcriptional regulator, chromosome partitioning protein
MTDLLPLDCIIDTDRLRPVDEAWVAALAESIRDHGLEQPIVVRPNPLSVNSFVLVAGCHRLAAFRLLGQTEIPVIVRQLSPDEARLVEIDENLMRRELDPLDRAVFMAERKAVWERMYPETAHGGDRKSRKKQGENQVATIATRFSKDVGKRTGLSERSVQLACRIYAELGPDAIARLRGTPLAGNQAQLLLLARMTPAERDAAIAAAVASQTSTVKAALRSAGLGAPEIDPTERQYRALCDLWDRAGAKARRRFLARIGVGEDEESDGVTAATGKTAA